MGREIRRVPPNWEHPRRRTPTGLDGHHVPLLDGSYEEHIEEWIAGRAEWSSGPSCAQAAQAKRNGLTYEEWDGSAPQPEEYMPDWPESERTHYQLYETCSEGTPITPVFASPEECARYAADNGVSWFGNFTATYDQWLQCCTDPTMFTGLVVSVPVQK